MFPHPHIGGQLARERQQDLLAQAARHHQLRSSAQTARGAPRVPRHPGLARRIVLQLRTLARA